MTHNERVLRVLSDGKPHSHHELYNLHVIAHSRVADLRKQGYEIAQWREGDLYLYRLLGGPQNGSRQGSVGNLRPAEEAESPSPSSTSTVGAAPSSPHLARSQPAVEQLTFQAA